MRTKQPAEISLKDLARRKPAPVKPGQLLKFRERHDLTQEDCWLLLDSTRGHFSRVENADANSAQVSTTNYEFLHILATVPEARAALAALRPAQRDEDDIKARRK